MRLLAKLQDQYVQDFSCSIVVVDNDAKQSGKSAVLSVKKKSHINIDYFNEPERSISLARNKAVQNAKGNLIAFIDDDELPINKWLINHYKALLASEADGVLGPVIPIFEKDTPKWLVKSKLLERKTFETGVVIKDSRQTRTGNALLWKKLFEKNDTYFDLAYGTTGGGDAVFFRKMLEKGKNFIWCNEAAVYETVPIERQNRIYYLKRAFTRGMTTAWETPFISFSTIKSLAAIFLYTASLPFLFFIGQHFLMKILVKDCDHIAKILAYLGINLVKQRPY